MIIISVWAIATKKNNKAKQTSSHSFNDNATNLKLRRIVPLLELSFYFDTYCHFILPFKEF